MFVTTALVLIYIANILIVIGLTTNNWLAIWDNNWNNRQIKIEFGLHRVCFKEAESCTNPGSNYDQSNYLPKVQVLAIFGGFMCMLSSFFSMLHLATDRLGWTHLGISVPASACAFLGAIFEMIALIIFSIKVELNQEYITFYKDIRLGWSFGLTCVAVSFLYIGGALQALSTMQKPGHPFE